jgi:hypothetical protein
MTDKKKKPSNKTFQVNMSKKALHDALWAWAFQPERDGTICSSSRLQEMMNKLYNKPRPKRSPTQ